MNYSSTLRPPIAVKILGWKGEEKTGINICCVICQPVCPWYLSNLKVNMFFSPLVTMQVSFKNHLILSNFCTIQAPRVINYCYKHFKCPTCISVADQKRENFTMLFNQGSHILPCLFIIVISQDVYMWLKVSVWKESL